jgi:subtilisin family serine protease
MPRRTLLLLALLAIANLSTLAVAEAGSSIEAPATAAAPGATEPLFSSQWALRAVGLPDARSAAGPGTIVAVLDTGVSPTHPELAGRVLPGIDLVSGDSDADDENGHGTAVAAMIGADGANGVGIAGACWSCLILPVRVLSSAGGAPWERIAAGVVWAVDHGARVINISISGTGESAELRAAVAYAAARDVLIVASAGNSGDARPQFPAALEGVVGVAATDPAGRLYDWSSRGAWVDVAVPGCSPLPMVFGTYAWACGTSFAAPLAAGVAALARGADPAASAVTIAARLPSLLPSASSSPVSMRIAGSPRPGVTLRATSTGLAGPRDLGERIRWFRCATTASPHGCVAASTGGTYRVRRSDTGSTLVARVVTEPFGGLWLASTRRLTVR